MTYVIKHKPTGGFVGSDGVGRMDISDAIQLESRAEAADRIKHLIYPHSEFEVVENVNNPQSMTSEETEAQRRSFAYGNAKIDNQNITREMIDKAADEIANTSQNPEG